MCFYVAAIHTFTCGTICLYVFFPEMLHAVSLNVCANLQFVGGCREACVCVCVCVGCVCVCVWWVVL